MLRLSDDEPPRRYRSRHHSGSTTNYSYSALTEEGKGQREVSNLHSYSMVIALFYRFSGSCINIETLFFEEPIIVQVTFSLQIHFRNLVLVGGQ